MSFSDFPFPKRQRLCSKRAIQNLFSHGKSFLVFPFKCLVLETPESDFPLKILISVPKNKCKKASDRNRIKRLARECLRLHSPLQTLNTENKKYHLALIYIHNEISDYSVICKSIVKILQRMSEEQHNNLSL